MNTSILIGRFQPLHSGHIHLIDRALQKYDNVIVLIGDTGGPRTIKNPWTYEERLEMFKRPNLDISRLTFRKLLDYQYNDMAWVSNVQKIVSEETEDSSTLTLIGFDKDASSYYLKMFPNWNQDISPELTVMHDATDVRRKLFEFEDITPIYDSLHSLADYICNVPSEDVWNDLKVEYDYIKDYRASWAVAPFPPIFVTVDAVVVGSGHVLLVKRGENPGKGLWALPGGFIDQDSSIEDNCIRELREETNIKLQDSILKGYINKVKVFDRSGGVSQEDRGRIITHAHLIRLDDTRELPKVKGGDDAAHAEWVPIHKISRENMFSDHYHIIMEML